MAQLPTPRILIASGEYELPDIVRGKSYLLTFRGDFDGATLALQFKNDATGEFLTVDNGSWTGAADEPREINFRAESETAQLLLDDAAGSTAIAITLVRHQP